MQEIYSIVMRTAAQKTALIADIGRLYYAENKSQVSRRIIRADFKTVKMTGSKLDFSTG